MSVRLSTSRRASDKHSDMPRRGGLYHNLGKNGSASQDSITRIAAQIVTGVGFLGAGAVIQDRGGIHGLTTAATIWLVASIGMACGARFYDLAIISTILALVVLVGLGQVDKYIRSRHDDSKQDKRSIEFEL